MTVKKMLSEVASKPSVKTHRCLYDTAVTHSLSNSGIECNFELSVIVS